MCHPAAAAPFHMVKRWNSSVQRTYGTRANTRQKVLREEIQTVDNDVFNHPGRLAPRWVEDLYAGELSDGQDGNDGVLYQPCASLQSPPRASGGGQHHELLLNPSQSHEGLVSTLCKNCRYHFIFRLANEDTQTCGDHEHQQYPFHHLVRRESSPDAPEAAPPRGKYYPIVGRWLYECSAKPCNFTVVVEVSEPRISAEFVAVITDKDRVHRQIEEALRTDPERFQGIAANAEQTAPITLDKYLRDVMDGDSSSKPKRIALRNKRFYVQFGEACSALFEYLEFTRLAEDDEQYWTLPSISSDEGSSIGSRRAFFEDAKSEVQSLIDSKIADEVVKPYPAKGQLQTALRCPPRTDLTSAAEKGQAGDLTVLGVTAKSSSKVLLYAYHCQANTDPRNQTRYLSALQSLANDRQDLDLQLEAVTIESLKDTPQLPAYTTDEPLANAYVHFQLPSDYNDGDDLIVGRYKTYRDNSPAQKLNHRLSLLTIGKARQSKRILDLAYGGMELDEAYQFLEADAAWPTESIAAFAESMVSNKDYHLLYEAMTIIGRQRDDVMLKRAAEHVRELGIGMERQASGIQDSITVRAGALQDDIPVRMDLPVGLENLRNTCYLNSILQYFFTVKPVRELILNIDEYEIEPTEDKLKNRRIGPNLMDLDFGDAFVAQNFVKELAFLFQNLHCAETAFIKPKQRLANAALLSARQLIKSVSNEVTQPQAFIGPRLPTPLEQDLPPPPPLPARPSPAPPSRSRDQPVVTVDAVPEPSETASNVSSQTLINHADAEGPMPDLPSDVAQPSIEVDDSQSAGLLTHEEPLMTIGNSKGSGSFDLSQAEPVVSVKAGLDDTGTAPDGVITPGETAPEIAATIEKLSPEPEMTTEQKLSKALDNQTIHGTDQEDVEEVMGKIIHHLHAAIRPTAIDPKTHAQTDQIVETFYCNTVNHTKKNNEATYRSEVVMERWLSAFPAETGPSGLYEALDRNFDQQFIDADTERFTSIKELPPVLHVHLQRTAPNGRKNENPIVIPEELFLDRYMDDGYTSTLFAKRKRGWNLKRRLAVFDEPPPGITPGTLAKEQAKQSQDIPEELLDDFVGIEKIFDVPETTEDGFDIIDPQLAQLLDANGIQQPSRQNGSTPSSSLKEPSIDDLDPELAKRFVHSLKSEKEQAQAELNSLFDGMTKYKYRLHAVICHGGGQSTSGHYWVWIYDFEQGIWRKYNDTRVTEDPDSASVLRMLSSKGEPYYLAYVRDEDKERWVDIPLRMRPQPQPQPQENTPGQAQNVENTDVEMQDVSIPELVPHDDIAQP